VSQLWWYTARAGGIVAWALLAASVVWGLFLSTRLRPAGAAPAWMLDLHRFLGGLAVLFVGVHVGAIVLDSYVHFSLADVLVPFAASWHPWWVVWGTVAMYLLLAVELTSLTRRWLPARLWRRVHVLSLPLFALASVHFLLAGSDAGNPFAILGVVLTAAAVAGLLVRRTSRGRSRPAHLPGRRGPAAPPTGAPLGEPERVPDHAGAVRR
jgi:DMSO/TMAO reductase YedYZ heme-binding membrane subunit